MQLFRLLIVPKRTKFKKDHCPVPAVVFCFTIPSNFAA